MNAKTPKGLPAGHVLGEARIAGGREGDEEYDIYFIFRYRFRDN